MNREEVGAAELQSTQTVENEHWLKDRGLDQNLRDEILVYMGQQGGHWLDFVQELVKYEGDFREISRQALSPREIEERLKEQSQK